MFKILKADRDSYITDRVVKGIRMVSASVGAASSLDLFKIFGLTSSGSYPNIELSRLLVHFDLDPLRTLISAGKIDASDPSFACSIQLFDVFGGQPNPSNFTVTVNPLARSFSEGLGRDVVFYSDIDVCNFLSGSFAQGAWIVSGANAGGHVTGSVDYITTATINAVTTSLTQTQLFVTGEEDLQVDVTKIVSATLAGIIPDEGFRVALTSSLETDNHTYFVKRFASRTAFNEDKHPRLVVRFDDSIRDDTTNMVFDTSGSLLLYNYSAGLPANIVSGSTTLAGSNCLILKLQTPVSAGFYESITTGSQLMIGSNAVTGVYSASVSLPSTNPLLARKLVQSGSVDFTPIWGSIDGTVGYLTGSVVTVKPAIRSTSPVEPKSYIVTVTGLKQSHATDEETYVNVNIFDQQSVDVKLVKLPAQRPGLSIRDVHYSIRDVNTNTAVIPFDSVNNSTRVSSSATGMYFKLDMSNLTVGRTYVVDIALYTNGNIQVFRTASPSFRIDDLR